MAHPIDRFYRERRNAPLWLGNPHAIARFVDLLRRAELDGFGAGPGLAEQIAVALRRAGSGGPSTTGAAELLISSAWVQYVQAISWPSPGIIYGDQALAPRIPQPLDTLRAAAAAHSLDQHVVRVSTVNPTYAQLRDAAWRARLSGRKNLERQIVTNMQRAKVLPATGRYIVIDVATARLWMFDDGRIRDTMKVVVGKPDQKTPLIASTVKHATLNPYWHVPMDMVQRIIAPNVLRDGVGYLQARGYELVSDYSESAQPLRPDSVNWAAVAGGTADARVRQRPGSANAMGEIKISFANSAGIYLHDTPDKSLFENDRRVISGGCIRLQDARRLTRWLLGYDPPAASGRPEQRIDLAVPVPIYLTYLTIHPTDGGLEFAEDVYGFDEETDASLAAG